MKLNRLKSFGFVLMMGVPAFSQVQLFEADVSGLVPYVGVKWNQGITEMLAGAEYTIDGRTTLGFSGSKPLKDTLTFDDKVHGYTINPYGIFEFIEPDNLKTFSFAIRADFVHEDSYKNEKTPSDTLMLNSFSRTQLGAGPIFALRIFSSDKLVMIPSASYEFYYVTYRRNQLIGDGTKGDFQNDNNLWHDLSAGCAFHFILNEFNGINFEPKIVAKFGSGHASNDLLNVTANLGYVLAF